MTWTAALSFAASAEADAEPGLFVVLGVGVGVTLLSLVVVVAVLRRCLNIVGPGQLLVLTGRRSVTRDGRVVGYRLVFGPGRAVRIPLLERADVFDLTPIRLSVAPRDIRARGGRPVFVRVAATVRISNDPDVAANAVDRFLNRRREEVARTAEEALEPVVREFAVGCDPERGGPPDEPRRRELERAFVESCAKLGLAVESVTVEKLTFGGGGIG